MNEFQIYTDKLLEWNEKINLTAITNPEEIQVKHFEDSLTCLKTGYIKDSDFVVDVGTGAGFPGLPLKIANKSLRLTLMDSLNKRLMFLADLTRELDLNVNIVHIRAEDAGKDMAYREKYDVAVSRAVANLRTLCEYCLPLVKPGGYVTVAHGMSRERINAHHSGAAAHVSNGLMEAKELSDIFARYLEVETVISDDKMYQVAGRKR